MRTLHKMHSNIMVEEIKVYGIKLLSWNDELESRDQNQYSLTSLLHSNYFDVNLSSASTIYK